MKTPVAAALVTIAVAVPAFLVTRRIWPPSAAFPQPTGAQLSLLLLLGVLETLLFGLGVAFVLFALPAVRRAARVAGVSPWPVYLSIAWLLLSWWPHGNSHLANGLDLNGIVVIDYIFHLSAWIATLVVARFFLAMLRSVGAATSPAGRDVAPSGPAQEGRRGLAVS